MTDATAQNAYTAYSYLTAGEDFRSFELTPEFGRVPPYAAAWPTRTSSGPRGCSGTAW